MLAVDAGTLLSGIIDALPVFPDLGSDSGTTEDISCTGGCSSSVPSSREDRITDATSSTEDSSSAASSSAEHSSSPEQKAKSRAFQIVNNTIKSFCITHPHLDHIAGLVINSACFTQQKQILGLKATIESLRKYVFNGHVWPDLEGSLISYKSLQESAFHTEQVATNLAVCPVQISHATCDSTVYFIRDGITDKIVCIWGDVEPDEVSSRPRNLTVWHQAAEYLAQQKLVAVLIECSYPSSHGNPLFGHMTPRYLVNELAQFAQLAGSDLEGLTVVITHIKEESPIPNSSNSNSSSSHIKSHQIIDQELQTLASQKDLRPKFILAQPGMSFVF